MKDRSVLLHLGCGILAPKGWVNIDNSWNALLRKYPAALELLKRSHIISRKHLAIAWPKNIVWMDVRKKLPYGDNSVDGIYSSHFLEHLTRNEAIALIKECYRVLKPGKSVRCIVPDLEAYVQIYKIKYSADWLMSELQVFPQESKNSFIERIYFHFNNPHIHKWMYDKTSLASRFTSAGFVHTRFCELFESNIPKIRLVERRERSQGTSICLEADKS